MKMNIRTYVLLTVLCLCIVLTACGKADPITVPATDDIVSITVINGEESITYDDTEWISQVISGINDAKPTTKQSVQDVPQVDNYIQIGIKLDKGTTILFLYQDDNKCYIEQPYEGIYEIDPKLYDYICETMNEVDNDTPGGIQESLEKWTGLLGQTQMTDDKDLIGSREVGIDDYVGSYEAACEDDSGRDVIFGGASTKERTLYVSGTVKTESGSATVRIRLNDKVIELTPDDNGDFETELSLESGGNYIMVLYEDFTGLVELRSAYDTNDSNKI